MLSNSLAGRLTIERSRFGRNIASNTWLHSYKIINHRLFALVMATDEYSSFLHRVLLWTRRVKNYGTRVAFKAL